MDKFALYALHGFLGKADDWLLLFNQHPFLKNLKAVNLVPAPLRDWIITFNQEIQTVKQKKILMGYSMGGRLALQSLIHDPKQWEAAIIISASPGIASLQERKERLILDEQWAIRFENDPWELLMEKWNANTVFENDSFQFVRHENEFDRKSLSNALKYWSVAHQGDLLKSIAELSMPILMIAGSEDPNHGYLKNLTLKHPFSRIWVAYGAGHRVPWQQRQAFLSQITQFIGSL